jgi:D-mannonate dehydratase
MKVKSLEHDHPIIFKRCLELLKENNLSYAPETDTIHRISDWKKTKEGFDIWIEVSIGNYKPFYDFYKTQKKMNTKLKVGDKVYFTKESAPKFNVNYLTVGKKYKVISVDSDMYFRFFNDNGKIIGSNIESVGHLNGGTWLIAKPKKKLQKKYDLLKKELDAITTLLKEEKDRNIKYKLDMVISILQTIGTVSNDFELKNDLYGIEIINKFELKYTI